MSRVLIVSNRLPITVKRIDGGFQVEMSAGGLATGLRGVHEQSGGLWIGWPGVGDDELSDDDRARLGSRFEELRVVPVALSTSEVERYYERFCNGILWPLFHYLLGPLPLEFQGYDLYEAVNQRFANAVCERYRSGDVIWVHDYQLMLVPSMVRERIPEARIGYFLHIPFPSSEVFRALPFRAGLLRGLLGADLIGFHTASYRRHFTSSVLRMLGIGAELDTLHAGDRRVRLGVFPMGVDVASFAALAAAEDTRARAAEVRGQGGVKILLGVDRMDYTKGLRRRLLAFERMLHKHPELHGKVRLVQCAAPSRTNVKAYQSFREEVETTVGRMVGSYATPEWVPVHFIMRGMPLGEIVPLYLAADVMLVTPIRDGMNLVAKEFVASRPDEDGVLVLSEFAGAASELPEALLINPFDIEGTADQIYHALTLGPEERCTRMRGLRKRVMNASVQQWAQSFLDTLGALAEDHAPRPAPTPDDVMIEVRRQLDTAEKLVLLLDYEGTLMPFAATPQLARPDGEVRHLLATLAARPGTEVHVMSGRDRDTMASWLGDLPLTLHAEHGLWTRPVGGQAYETDSLADVPWREPVREIMRGFAERTPGALVEEKASGLAFHYRSVDPDFAAQQANELRQHLLEMFSNAPVAIVAGDKVIEVRPQSVHKGRIVERIRERLPDALLVVMGDDDSDEDAFAALPEAAVSIHVGPGYSKARYRLATIGDVRDVLHDLVD
jgi:trehalose 6-phosphate synthase/phosphatase